MFYLLPKSHSLGLQNPYSNLGLSDSKPKSFTSIESAGLFSFWLHVSDKNPIERNLSV